MRVSDEAGGGDRFTAEEDFKELRGQVLKDSSMN